MVWLLFFDKNQTKQKIITPNLHGIGNVYQGFLLILMVQEWDATKTELMVRCSGRHKLSNCAWFKLNLCVSNQGPNWNFFLLSYPSITRKLVEDLVPSESTIVKFLVYLSLNQKMNSTFSLVIGIHKAMHKVIYPIT